VKDNILTQKSPKMHIHFLASFMLICTYSALLTLGSPTKQISEATKSGNNSEISANNDYTTNAQNATITSTNKNETPITVIEGNAKTLANNTIGNEATPEGSNKTENESSKISDAIKSGNVSDILASKANMTNAQNTTITTTSKKEPTFLSVVTKQPDHAGSGFHGLSFFLGILFSTGVIIVSYGCYRHYKKSTRNNSLLSQEGYSSF
jgi:hypothetical protein